jgi:hypothetical protein
MKFHVGQVVEHLESGQYVRISARHKQDGEWRFSVYWDGDPDYDYCEAQDFRPLTKKEKG